MRDADAERLRVPYESPVEPVPDDRRLNARLDFGIDSVIDLADQFVTDLDPSIGGIGWWQVYPELDRQKRAFISDYLASSARSICFNLHESYVHRIELNHAVDDFKEWIERGIGSGQPTIPPPQNLYDDLSYVRVNASLAGTLRAFASSLDCIGACIVGV